MNFTAVSRELYLLLEFSIAMGFDIVWRGDMSSIQYKSLSGRLFAHLRMPSRLKENKHSFQCKKKPQNGSSS